MAMMAISKRLVLGLCLLRIFEVFLFPRQNMPGVPQAQAQDSPKTPQGKSLPLGLRWVDNLHLPSFASPKAKKGGEFKTIVTLYPPTFRMVGPESQNGFSALRQALQMRPLGRHPFSKKFIPQLAKSWAFGDDGKTLYFKLYSESKWSDGVKLKASDFAFGLKYLKSSHIRSPWLSVFFQKNIASLDIFDDETFSVTLVKKVPREELVNTANIPPMPEHALTLNESFLEANRWTVFPVLGPYQISDFSKNKFIVMERRKNWWGLERPFLRGRFNVDKIRLIILSNVEFGSLFLKRKFLDYFRFYSQLRWKVNASDGPFQKGEIHKLKIYHQRPRADHGIWLNTLSPPLNHLAIRKGLSHSFDFDGLNKLLYKGQLTRLATLSEGQGAFTNPKIRPRSYDLKKAEKYFRKAGYRRKGPKGLFEKDGVPLSFRLDYSDINKTKDMAFLKKKAALAGITLRPRYLSFKRLWEVLRAKEHQLAYAAFRALGKNQYYSRFFGAFGGRKGNDNIVNIKSKSLDEALLRLKKATIRKTQIDLSWSIQQQIHDEAVFLPGLYTPFYLEAFWAHWHFPRFWMAPDANGIFDLSLDRGGLFWFDEKKKGPRNKGKKKMAKGGEGQRVDLKTIYSEYKRHYVKKAKLR